MNPRMAIQFIKTYLDSWGVIILYVWVLELSDASFQSCALFLEKHGKNVLDIFSSRRRRGGWARRDEKSLAKGGVATEMWCA